MKLYVYDHCPFCVRAAMVAGYKDVDLQIVPLLNDDEVSCHQLIGKKMVPILAWDDQAMGESLDIAKKLDEIGSGVKLMRAPTDYQSITALISSVQRSISCLLFPRNIQAGLPEFATPSARDYFQRNKEPMIEQSFATAMADTALHKQRVETMLASLPHLSLPSENGDTLGWDDVMIYPTLRNLTLVQDLQIPQQVRDYLQEIAALTRTELYYAIAI